MTPAITNADAAVLPTLLTALGLPSIGRNWKRIAETADRDGWPAARVLPRPVRRARRKETV